MLSVIIINYLLIAITTHFLVWLSWCWQVNENIQRETRFDFKTKIRVVFTKRPGLYWTFL